jgi:flagellar biosynthesis regulator FlbT
MFKLNQNQIQPKSNPDDYIERESTSKYFSMNKGEKKMFRETFFSTLLDFMHQIVKDGRIVGSSDPIWEHVASKLDNILKPKSIYNRFILNKHSCRTRLIEAYLKDPKSQTTDISILNHMMKTDMHHEIVEKRPGHVDNQTFYDALFVFKDKVLRNGQVAPSVDSVWNQISAHLNHALKPNSIYLRLKRNTHNCHKKLLAHCKLDPSKAKTYDVPSRKLASPVEKPFNKIKKKSLKFEDSSKFFKALYSHRHMIIQNGSIARYNNSVWNEVAKMLDYALQPSDVHSKFIRNHDLCQTKLIEACKEDENFTPLVVPKFNKPNCVSDEVFFNILCRYRDDILQNGSEIAKFSHPVWTQISKDLNDTLKPATVYFRVTRNSQLCLNRLLKPELLTDHTYKDIINKDKFFETICLYKYSIMNGDVVVDLNDPVWNEISLQLNSVLSPEAIYDIIYNDKDLCKTKMIQALKTERSVFSGENPEISENINEYTPIVECNISNEPIYDFNEIINEFKDSILQPNGQMALKDDPIWKQISCRLKDLSSDEVYSRVINDYKNCRTRIFGVKPVHKNRLFEAIFAYRQLVISNNSIANINDEVWIKISEKLNFALTPKEIYSRFIKDIDGCRTKLLKSSKKDWSRSQGVDKDKFLDIIISHKDSILKNGSHAKPSDPIWREIASKLNFLVKPLTLYNNFMLNRHNCQQKLLEACELDKNELAVSQISSKITSQMDHDYIKGDIDTTFEDLVYMRQKVGYVQENDFIEACLVFKDRLVKNNCIVPSTDKVWNDISKYLNYAIKSKTAYLRFKRNTHNCQGKLFGVFQLNELSYDQDEESYSIDDQSIENEMFFDAISIFKHSIINNGSFAMESSPVWLDVSNLMNNLLTPDEAFWKFRQNIDSCRTKLIKKCLADWNNEPSSVIQNRIQVMKSKESLWKKNLISEHISRVNGKNYNQPLIMNEDVFYDAIYKHKSDIFHNDLVANSESPVWTAIAKELNNELEPSTIYLRFKNNMTKCNLKFAEAAQRHSLYKLNQKQSQMETQILIDENSYDSYDQNMVIDYDDDCIVESDVKNFEIKDYSDETSTIQ